MSRAMTSRRLVLKLDGSMTFEALILNRFAQLPDSRREAWLRGLLIEGFKSECRTAREFQADSLANPSESAHRPPPEPRRLSAGSAATPCHPVATSPADRPVTVATLRRMIG